MELTIYDEKYTCSKVIKGSDFIKAYDENGNIIISCKGISNFAGYHLEGGDYSPPEPTKEEKIQADIDYLLMLEGTL